MIFNNVSVLGYKHENKFFGEKSLSYASLKTFSIRGYILDLTSANGVDKILQDFLEISNKAKTFQNIVLNGENFGVGKVKSLNIDAGNWVRTTEYTADIEILSEAPLQNISSSEFTGLTLTNKQLKLLKSLNESFNVDFDNQSKILSGEHSIEIEYDADNSNVNLIALAQSLASELLKTLPTSVDQANYNTRSNYRTLNSENYDVINGKAGFRRSFSYNTGNNIDQPYSIKREHSLTINEEGIAEVKESCEIKAESDKPSLYENALIGLNSQLSSESAVYTRALNFFIQYQNKFGISRNINSHFLSKEIQINKFAGIINYTVTFDNDPKKANPLYSWENTKTLDRAENGVWSVSEEGAINGIGKIGESRKYLNAENGWNSVKSGIFSRINSFYIFYAKPKSGGNLEFLSKSVNKSKYNGSINYNYSYSDDPAIQSTGDIKKIETELSDTGLQLITKNFIVPNNRYSILQNRTLLQQGTFTVSVKMSIGCITGVFNGLNYFNTAKASAGFSKRVGFSPLDPFDFYLESASFSSDEVEKTVSYEEVYKYS
jgi:hypothetical protein